MVALVPLLYALSTTASDSTIRAGRMTTWRYVGGARRALGQRDFVLDGGSMVGMQHVAAIEFDGTAERSESPPQDAEAADASSMRPEPEGKSKAWWRFW